MEARMMISTIEDYLYSNEEQITQLVLHPERPYVLDFKDLQTFDAELAQKLLDAQSDFLEDFLEQIRIRLEMRSVRNYNIPIRITNLEYKCLLREISNEKIGRLVAVDGIVTQVSVAELIIIKAQYRCLTCNDVQTINQNSQYTIYPKKCLSSDCTDGRGFEIVPEASTFKRVQHIVIQELPDQVPPGKIPAKLKADLEEDLVEAVKPGERVTLIGVLSGKTRKKGDTHPIVVPYLLINNVISEREDTALDISDEDVEDFKKMVSENDHLDKITRSIAPTIYGNPEVKQAIALQQCEGVTKEIHGNRKRGQSHILLAGDASQGKSELIDFAVRLHPRGIKTTGKGATAAGLTAAVVKDEETGQWTLLAGAMVLADRGIVGADEIEKMRPEDRSSMHPAMAQQRIHINKAGINTDLNTRCSVIAACNPTTGRWLDKPITDNLSKLPSPLLSRFDLIFVLKTSYDTEEEMKKVEYVIDLQTKPESSAPPYDVETLRKFFSWARTINPTIDWKVGRKLSDYYRTMFKSSVGTNALMITVRQLEGLIRLTEASAKLHGREVATDEDAEVAIVIMDKSIRQAGLDPTTGEIDIGMVTTGIPKSRGDKIAMVQTVVRHMMKENIEDDEVDEVYVVGWIAEQWRISETQAKTFVNRACTEGLCHRPRFGKIKA